MLYHAKIDKCFGTEAEMTAICTKNRLHSPKCQDKTPFEIVNGFRPSVKHTRVFGCQVFMLTPKEKRSKWDPKAREAPCVGYEEVSKAYQIYDIEVDRVMISRDVTFNESAFVFSPTSPHEKVDDTALDFDSMSISDESFIMQFKQTGNRKDRSNNQEQAFQQSLPARHGAGTEEASVPEDSEPRQSKRRPSTRTNLGEERKDSDEDDDNATPSLLESECQRS